MLSATLHLYISAISIMWCSYWSAFLSSGARRSLRARTSRETCRSCWASRTTLTRRTLQHHHTPHKVITLKHSHSKMCILLYYIRAWNIWGWEQFPEMGLQYRRLEWENENETEDTNAVNCTHSRARWAMRTLISLQAVSPLQNRIKWRL